MKKNMGTIDRVLRILIVAAIAILYLTGVISGAVAIVLGFIAVAFMLTCFISWCPLYWPFGISTCKKDDLENKS
jgi:hypothetical protein